MVLALKIMFRYFEILFLALLLLSKYSTMHDPRMDGIPGLPFDTHTKQLLAVLLIIVLLIIIFRKWTNAPVNAFDIVVAVFFGILIFPEVFSLLWFTEIGLGSYLRAIIVYGVWSMMVFREIICYTGIPSRILLIIVVPVMVSTFIVHKVLLPTSFLEMPVGTLDKISIYVQINGLLFFGAAVLTAITVINLVRDKWFQSIEEKRTA
jgi:hypothetical protein